MADNDNFPLRHESVRSLYEFFNHPTNLMRQRRETGAILKNLSPPEKAAVKRVLDGEENVLFNVMNRYAERLAAKQATGRSPHQRDLMQEYGIVSETNVATLATLGINRVFNDAAEKAAFKKDLPEILATSNYDPAMGRKLLAKYGIKNFVGV